MSKSNGNDLFSKRFDVAIVGGGVIGLSIAWELSRFDLTIAVIDRQQVGREASWAGAGILPPWNKTFAHHPIEMLSALSFDLHEQWAANLINETGIDTGYRKCGAAFVARTLGEKGALIGQIQEWEERGIKVNRIDHNQLVAHIPVVKTNQRAALTAAFLPEEAQLRNPDHLRALVQSCEKNGVVILEEQGDVDMVVDGQRIDHVITAKSPRIEAEKFCVAAGAWSEALLKPLGVRLSTLPVRGQMLLYQLPQRLFKPILYEGTRYIVPRDDGHIVVGATLEEAGFDKSTTDQGVGELRAFSEGWIDGLNEANLVKTWAGLRPASFDGFPYIGTVAAIPNLLVATGHFRNGLLLSTGTARLISQLVREVTPEFDLSPFRIERG